MILLAVPFLAGWTHADAARNETLCEQALQSQDGDDDWVNSCMKKAGYRFDDSLKVDALTHCGDLLYPQMEGGCYRSDDTDASDPVQPALPHWRSMPIKRLIARDDDLDGKCRGGLESWVATANACNQRDRITVLLKARNWCWGGKDPQQIEADKIWQRCEK